MVHGALRLILEPIFEADFSDSSFGARPGRSAHEAIEKVRTGLRRRRHCVVDVDLSRYFDTIRHDRMLAKVARRISDGQVLAMVKQFLKSTGQQGVPQGRVRVVGPLSGLPPRIRERDSAHQPHGCITPMDDASAASWMRETRLSSSRWRGSETK